MATLAGGEPVRPVRLGIVGAARILPAHLRGMKALLDADLARFRITAIAAAWTAKRVAEGIAQSLPAEPEVGFRGLKAQISY